MSLAELLFVFFFKQKTAYEIYQCDWSSDVCSSDLNNDKADGSNGNQNQEGVDEVDGRVY